MEIMTNSKTNTRFLGNLVAPKGRRITNHKTFLICLLVMIVILTTNGCSSANPLQEDTPNPPSLRTATLHPTPVPTETRTPQVIDFSQLIPMYEASSTANLAEDEILPQLDITSNAEQQLRDAGFGEKIDQAVNDLMKYAQQDSSLYLHTLEPVYALNTYSKKPVYTIFLYDKSIDCLLIPMYTYGFDKNNPKAGWWVYAHSGDVTEIIKDAKDKGGSIYIDPLPSPAGTGIDIRAKLIATNSGITVGVFDEKNNLIGWFDFEDRIWNLSSKEREMLVPKLTESDTNLQSNIDDWMSGKTTIDNSLIFDAGGGKPISFNYFDRSAVFGSGNSERLYGVLLGTKKTDGSQYIVVGFEDVASKRYYFPFNLGKVEDQKINRSFATTTSVYGEWRRSDKTSKYMINDFTLVIANYVNKPIVIQQTIGKYDKLLDMEVEPNNADEYNAQLKQATSISKYIYNSATQQVGGDKLGGLVSPPLDSITSEMFPAFFGGFLAKE